MPVRHATETDIPAITDIYNQAVLHTVATWNESTVTQQDRLRWLHDQRSCGYPVIVYTDDTDQALGYATFGSWRAWEGYRHTVEHSVYVHDTARGQGAGTQLIRELIRLAREQNMHIMVAGITGENTGSIKLHERLGFERVGTMPQVGTKFGRWLDLVFLQLKLSDAAYPAELPERRHRPGNSDRP